MKHLSFVSKVFVLFLALWMAFQPLTVAGAEAETSSGSCGENLTWTLDENDVLTVSGTGRMQHMYGAENFPWHPYRDRIREVILEEGITFVAADAFADCTALERVQTPATLEMIGGGAFMGCAKLTDVVLCDGLDDIATEAFSGTGLTQITIPDTVTYIGWQAFQNTPLESIVIPESVTTVGYYAFSGCTRLRSVTLSPNASTVGMYCFDGCTALESITIPLNCIAVRGYAFRGCTALRTVTFEGDAPIIDADVFEGVTATVYYPAGNDTWTAELMRDYGGDLTWTAYERTAVELAGGTCGEGVNWSVYDDGLLEITGTGAMNDFKNSVTPWKDYREHIDEIRVGEGVTHIADWAFSGCINAVNVSLPAGLTSIGECAFTKCSSMSSIELPDTLTELGANAFSSCTALQTVELPDSLTSIGHSLFYKCTALTTVTIPAGITELKGYTFNGCKALETVYLPASLTELGEVEFEYCPSLKGIWVDEESSVFSNDENGILFNADKTKLVICPGGYEGPYEVPGTVTEICENAFDTCQYLTAVHLPDSVQTIGAAAFAECYRLEQINIPDGMTEISEFMLSYCEALPSLTLPDSIAVIGDAAFMGCESLTGLVLPDSVHTIGSTAFGECYSLTEMVIPDGVPCVDWQLFRNCSKLVSVTLPDSVREIGDTAFMNCHALRSVNIPDGVTSISYGAFMRCYALSAVDLPDSLTHIGINAFYNCTNLRRIEIPAGVTKILAYAFHNCIKLEEAILHDGITDIERYAFYGCEALKSVDLPEALTFIGKYALGYTSMTEVEIPAAVTEIGDYAFINDFIDTIYFLGSAPFFAENSLAGLSADAYYPLGDASWTPDVMQDYGGDIVWGGYSEERIYRAAFTQASISLEGDIGLNFYAKLSDDIAAAEDAYLKFYVNAETKTIPVSMAQLCEDGTYRFSCPLSAKEMTAPVMAQMYTSQGPVGAPKTYSVKQYCSDMIDYVETNGLTGYDALLDLMKALLNYGAYSQIGLDYRTGDLANVELTDEEKTLPAQVDASAYAHRITGSEPGIQIYSASLLLESTTTMRFYFSLTGEGDIDAYTFLADGRAVTPRLAGDLYYIDITDINAKDLDQMHTVTVGGLTVQYCGLSYVHQVMSWSAAPQTIRDTAKALYTYAMAANAYFEA